MSRPRTPRKAFRRLVETLVKGGLDRLMPGEQELFMVVDRALQGLEEGKKPEVKP